MAITPTQLASQATDLSAYVPGGQAVDLQGEANAMLAAGNPQAAASLVGLSADDMATIRAAARSPADLTSAVAGYVNLDANQKAAVSALASGNYKSALSKAIAIGGQDLGLPPGLTTDLIQGGQSMLSGNLLGAIGPLVAAGLAAAGVGAPVIACVGGAIALGEVALQALGVIKSGSGGCDWKLGNTCFNGDRPYGPKDPLWTPLSRHWNTGIEWPWQDLDQYAASVYWEVWWLEGYLNAPETLPAALAHPKTAAQLGASVLYGLGQTLSLGGIAGTPVPVTKSDWLRSQYHSSPAANNRALDGFRLAFGRTYLANLEKGVNGHPMTNPHQLLNQIAYAWNAQHAGTSVTVNGDDAPSSWPSLVFQNTGGGSPFVGGGSPNAPRSAPPGTGAYRETMIEKILRGDVDKVRDAPLQVFTGPPYNFHAATGGFRLAAPIRVGAAQPKAAPSLLDELPEWAKIAGGAVLGIGAALGIDRLTRK